MKISIISDNAGWVIDSIKRDYEKYSSLQIVPINGNPDLIWCLNFWSLPKCDFSKKIIAQVHHINRSKIHEYDFSFLEKVKCCLCYNDEVMISLKNITPKPIFKLPYWLLSHVALDSSPTFKKKLSPNGEILIGSFQKDGENKSNLPKLIKGPDVFVEIVTRISKVRDIKVILSGYCRDWIMSKLEENNVKYEYFPNYKKMNDLYSVLDWYFITSRVEGGPQAVLEAPFHRVKTLSTDVGIAREILHANCICSTVDDFVNKFNNEYDFLDYNYSSVNKRLPEKIIPLWDEFFLNVESKLK